MRQRFASFVARQRAEIDALPSWFVIMSLSAIGFGAITDVWECMQ